MAHLKDRLAEFFYGELPSAEMVEARQHLADCGECRLDVERFEKTHLALKALPDDNPPRRIVFGPSARRSWFPAFVWQFASPVSAFAALIIVVVMALSPKSQPAAVQTSSPAPVVVQAQNVDYDRIVNEVRQSDREWVAGELIKRDKEIQRLQGQLAYYESFQRAVITKEYENASSIQLLAQRTDSQD